MNPLPAVRYAAFGQCSAVGLRRDGRATDVDACAYPSICGKPFISHMRNDATIIRILSQTHDIQLLEGFSPRLSPMCKKQPSVPSYEVPASC